MAEVTNIAKVKKVVEYEVTVRIDENEARALVTAYRGFPQSYADELATVLEEALECLVGKVGTW